jgi:peptidoglycan/LPS O-acetylase OafA/YrhL
LSKKRTELPGRWGWRKRDFGLSVWVAFLAACAGSFVVFAVIDPEALNDAWVLPWEMGSRLAYSLGFVFLFVVGLIASGLTAFMIRSGPRRGHARGKGRQAPPDIHPPEENNPDLDLEDWK